MHRIVSSGGKASLVASPSPRRNFAIESCAATSARSRLRRHPACAAGHTERSCVNQINRCYGDGPYTREVDALTPHLVSTADRVSGRLGYRRDDE
jgi:hypothetical protein